jgi:hypothetical protein
VKIPWSSQAKRRFIEKLGRSEKYGKRRQITFRIGPLAERKLEQVAALYHLRSSAYVKALLYKDLGIFDEALDGRRRRTTDASRKVLTAELDPETGEYIEN